MGPRRIKLESLRKLEWSGHNEEAVSKDTNASAHPCLCLYNCDWKLAERSQSTYPPISVY